MKKVIAILIFFVSVTTACKRETEITGEVFVVTQGKDSKKLGLVPVTAYKADDVLFRVGLKEAERKTKYDEADKALKDCSKYSGRVPDYYSEYEYKMLGLECEATAKNLLDLVPATYFGDFGVPQGMATTDADGKFSFKLSKPGKYVLAATSNRTVTGDRTETYYWLVAVDAKGEAVKITLSNNNLVEPDVSPASYIQGTK